MEELREELYKCIELYGLSDLKTIVKSQELDKLIIKCVEVRK